MLIKLLLLLAIGIKQVTAICFHNETSNVKRNVTGRPKAVDDYHCKIMCVEKTDCLAYIFPENECFLLGNLAYDAYTTCIKQYYEWVKKTNDGDCPDIPQPKIDDEYEPNPALALATPIENLTLSKYNPLPKGDNILDTILPDNSHQVEAIQYRMIVWDGKLGTWLLIKSTWMGNIDSNTTTYIRAVKGFTINPTDFSDSTSCGNIPTMTVPLVNQTQYESTGPPKQNAQQYADMCTFPYFMHIRDHMPDYVTVSSSNDNRIACVDGSWLLFRPYSYKIVRGTCVKPK